MFCERDLALLFLDDVSTDDENNYDDNVNDNSSIKTME